MWKSEDHLWEFVLLPLVRSLELNSVFHAWWQTPLPIEPWLLALEKHIVNKILMVFVFMVNLYKVWVPKLLSWKAVNIAL